MNAARRRQELRPAPHRDREGQRRRAGPTRPTRLSDQLVQAPRGEEGGGNGKLGVGGGGKRRSSQLLVDILGLEDHYGDMDFKVGFGCGCMGVRGVRDGL